MIDPFGYNRETYFQTIWTLDMERDILVYQNADGRKSVPLSLLREHAVTLSDLKAMAVPRPVAELEGPYWEPHVDISHRMRSLTHRLLSDFNYRWAYLLRSDFRDATLRRLARGVICLSALDFHTSRVPAKNDKNWYGPLDYHYGYNGKPTALPAWDPFEPKSDIIYIGTKCVILCQSVREGLSIARQHAFSRPIKEFGNSKGPHYMILSVKHIVLACVPAPGSLWHTAPEPLLNGDSTTPLSEVALDYLVWATTYSIDFSSNRLQAFPVEIQDLIVDHLAEDAISRAKIGCSMGLGSTFSWRGDGRDITIICLPNRPVEDSEVIYVEFGDQDSGLAYHLE